MCNIEMLGMGPGNELTNNHMTKIKKNKNIVYKNVMNHHPLQQFQHYSDVLTEGLKKEHRWWGGWEIGRRVLFIIISYFIVLTRPSLILVSLSLSVSVSLSLSQSLNLSVSLSHTHIHSYNISSLDSLILHTVVLYESGSSDCTDSSPLH